MERGSRRAPRRAALAAAALGLSVAGALALRACEGGRRGDAVFPTRADRAATLGRDASPSPGGDAAVEAATAGLPAPEELLAPSPSAGWEEAAGDVAADLRRVLDGRPGAGAYAEARVEAARRDLALFPPDAAGLRRRLLGSEGERVLALAALAARAEPDDDLVSLVLRSQRPEDDDVVRLLGAELAAALPPDAIARHEDELLRAFAGEPNPLVLAVALPALERLEEPRLRALLRAQLAKADAEMLPVLLALARARVAPSVLEDLEAGLAAAARGE